MQDYSDAIRKGVSDWCDAHKAEIMQLMAEALRAAADAGVEAIAAGAMIKVGKFLDQNRDDFIAGFAAAMAASWNARRPGPPVAGEGS